MAERRVRGKSASPGLAIGALVVVDQDRELEERRQGLPEEEQTALEAAIAKAMSDLEALADVASGDGADILAFQIEMLSDPALVEDVLPLIDGGQDAASAWKTGLDQQLAIYKSADDDYFKARASDLEDLQDRVLRVLRGASVDLPDIPAGAILVAHDLPPSRFLSIDAKKLGGLVLTEGNASSHVAILVRARGLPMIVDLEAAIETGVDAADTTTEGILDANEGHVLIDPAPETRKRYEARRRQSIKAAREAAASRDRPAVTADGQTVSVLVNIDDPAAVDDALLAASDGVGLLRTEFLLIGRQDLPGEDEHFQTYVDLQRRLAGKQLIIRTLDIGGDKPLPGLELPKEGNPFLGLRGIRLCLDHPDLFKPQVRALLRAAAKGPLQVMLPMVAVQAEIEETRRLFDDCLEELRREGVAAAMPDIGVMVETPAAAIAADQLDAAHFSIGSNDLIQYTMAAARDGTGRVAALQDPQHPAIERLIKMVVDHGAATGKDVSVCGNMASEPACLPLLLRVGMRKISVLPGMFDQVKATIATIDLGAEADRP
ncbi:MAG: phosphoenolpyruvate--protein phosphotransferase [Geminicoccaceae bacterium]